MMATTGEEPVSAAGAKGKEAASAAAAAGESPFADVAPAAEREEGEAARPDGSGGGLDLVLDVPVRLSVELGRTEIAIRDVVNLTRGSIVDLDRSPGEALDVRVNGVLVGRGEIVVVNEERLGLRFVEVVSPAERIRRLN
jgi:flagellar motor switch protein FliN/FliY